MKKDRELQAYEVMRRIAQVREIRATAALASAASKEQKQRAAHEHAISACDAVVSARDDCLAQGATVALGRYEMLSLLGSALEKKRHEASAQLAAASKVRETCAADSVKAKRSRERVDERVEISTHRLEREQAQADQSESVEMWLSGRERS